MEKKWMIYGATGYTGKLICEKLKNYKLRPIIAGRNEKKVIRLADLHGLRYRVFDLTSTDTIENAIDDIDFVLNIAGPIWNQINLLVESCIKKRKHYLDLVASEYLETYDQQAQENGVMLLPGIGFAVVPSDCLSGYLVEKISDANKLTLFLSGLNTVSRGTARGGFEIFKTGIRHRKNGVLTQVKDFSKRVVDFGEDRKACVPMTWGDVLTAYHSFGIKNIETYFEATKFRKQFIFAMKYLRPLFASPFIQNKLLKMVDKWPEGPSEEKRNTEKNIFIGIVENDKGDTVSAKITTPEGYKTTYLTTLKAVEEVIAGKIKPGIQTPYTLFGYQFIHGIEGCILEDRNASLNF